MSIEINGVGMGDTQLANPKSDILGKDDFLNLLVAQLQHQDPLSPMESAEFTAQLAQFSSLEQLGNVNDKLDYLQLCQASLNNSKAVSLIGKNVEAVGNSIYLNNGTSNDLNFELGSDASSVDISIYDASGNLVQNIQGGALNSGEQTIKWDGADNEGNKLSDGIYFFEVFARDADENQVPAQTFTNGRVTEVIFKNGDTRLVAGEREISVNDVIRIAEPED